MFDNKLKFIPYGGITIALMIISLYIGCMIRNSSVFFLALSCFISSIPYIKFNIKNGLLIYAASAILSLIIIPDTAYAITFIFTGIYSLIKLIAESRHNLFFEYLIKYIWANATLGVLYFIFTRILETEVILKKSVFGLNTYIIFFICFQIIFLIFDLVFSKFIFFYKGKFPSI